MEHFDRSSLLVLHDYNTYANNLVFETASQMNDEALASVCSPSHGSVQALLFHMMGVEYYFFMQAQGQAVQPGSEPPTMPPVSQLRDIYGQIMQARRAYLENTTDEELEAEVEIALMGRVYRLPRWQLLVQSLVHSTHHRGELSIVMTQCGAPLPTLDIIIPFVKDSGQEWG